VGLVILDRDGVINEDSDEFIKSPEEWVPVPGSLEAIARLNQNGYRVVVASNQSGIARRLFDIEALNRIHDKMLLALSEVGGTIDALFFCPHKPSDRCRCRKPEPGMLLDIAERLRTPLDEVPVVGDSLRDLQAATAVSSRPILVRTGKGTDTEAAGDGLDGAEVYDDLAEVAEVLITELEVGES